MSLYRTLKLQEEEILARSLPLRKEKDVLTLEISEARSRIRSLSKMIREEEKDLAEIRAALGPLERGEQKRRALEAKLKGKEGVGEKNPPENVENTP